MDSYEIVPIDGITQTTVEGGLDFEVSRRILLAIARENEHKGKNLLIDLRGADSHLSYTDVYQLVQVLREHPEAFSGKLALLDTFREGFEQVQFFEAFATELGFRVRAFLDADAADAWLHADRPPAD